MERGAQRGRRDFAHWSIVSEGGLYTAGRLQCTKSLPNGVRSVQSRLTLEDLCTKSRPNRVASVQSRAVRTGRPVQTGVCTVAAGSSVQSPARTGSPACKAGPCALGGLFRRGFAQCHAVPHHGSGREFRPPFRWSSPAQRAEASFLSNGQTAKTTLAGAVNYRQQPKHIVRFHIIAARWPHA